MRSAALIILALLAIVAVPSAQVSIAIDGRAVQPGEVLVVSVSGMGTTERGFVRVLGRRFSLFAAGTGTYRALVGLDLDAKAGPSAVTVWLETDGRARQVATKTITVVAKRFPTRRLTVEPRFVEPPPAEAARIEAEAKRLADLWTVDSAKAWLGRFVPPVPDPANSAFGSRSVFNGQARSPHGGADFASPAGRPVVSPGAGRVLLVGDLYFTGRTVVVDHGLGLVSLFAHLSEMTVTEGQLVAAGDRLGSVGATGRVTGPHLHWTLRLAGARVDPVSLLSLTAQIDEPNPNRQ